MYANIAHLAKSHLGNNFRFYIVFAWCLGLIIGLHIIPSQISVGNWSLRIDTAEQGSFPALMLTAFFPIVLAIVCAKRKQTTFLLLLCFLKATLYGFSLLLIYSRFASGAWLGRFLFLLTDTVSSCTLLWFSLSCGANCKIRTKKATALCFLMLLAVCSFDSFVLTPFLHSLF